MFNRQQLFGKAPIKIRFDGVPAGSKLARLLYAEQQAPINQFISKARQQAMLSGQPGAHMQQALPGGGHIWYSFNHGLETVRVKLSSETIEQTATKLRKPQVGADKVFLAIDVLWDLKEHLYYDLFTYNFAPNFNTDDYYTRETIWAANAAYDVGLVYNPGGSDAASIVFQRNATLPEKIIYPVIATIPGSVTYSDLPQAAAMASCALVESDGSGAPVALDVYAASYNSLLKNSATQRALVPDTDFYAGFEPEATFKIQVRELNSKEIRRVQVSRYFGQRRRFTAFNFRNFNFNLISQGTTTETTGGTFNRDFKNLRSFFTYFVTEDFVPAPGSANIAPGGDGMGRLLSATDPKERTLVGPHNDGRDPWSAGWDVPGNGGESARSVGGMTKIAEILWVPVRPGEDQGTATIDLDV